MDPQTCFESAITTLTVQRCLLACHNGALSALHSLVNDCPWTPCLLPFSVSFLRGVRPHPWHPWRPRAPAVCPDRLRLLSLEPWARLPVSS